MNPSSKAPRTPSKCFHAARENAVFGTDPPVGNDERSAARRTVCAVALQLAPEDPAALARDVLAALGLDDVTDTARFDASQLDAPQLDAS